MTIEDWIDDDYFGYKGMQQTVKTKVVNLLQSKLEVQNSSRMFRRGTFMHGCLFATWFYNLRDCDILVNYFANIANRIQETI